MVHTDSFRPHEHFVAYRNSTNPPHERVPKECCTRPNWCSHTHLGSICLHSINRSLQENSDWLSLYWWIQTRCFFSQIHNFTYNIVSTLYFGKGETTRKMVVGEMGFTMVDLIAKRLYAYAGGTSETICFEVTISKKMVCNFSLQGNI